jgi:hypothetical protein
MVGVEGPAVLFERVELKDGLELKDRRLLTGGDERFGVAGKE